MLASASVRTGASTDDQSERPNPLLITLPLNLDNRLQYLVSKGAILRKGQRVRTKFCKFSATPQDRLFVAVLYTSDSDKIMRYTDEGETIELCRWTVDLGTLPSFQQHANNPQPGGFYTGEQMRFF